MTARAPRPPMGIATEKTVENKNIYAKYLQTFETGKINAIEHAVNDIFTTKTKIDAFHPVNITTGSKGTCASGGLAKTGFDPLKASRGEIIYSLVENTKVLNGSHQLDIFLVTLMNRGWEFLPAEDWNISAMVSFTECKMAKLCNHISFLVFRNSS